VIEKMADSKDFLVDPKTMKRYIEEIDGKKYMKTVFTAEMDDKQYVEFIRNQQKRLEEWKKTFADAELNMAEIEKEQRVNNSMCENLVNDKAFQRKLKKWNSCIALSRTIQLKNKAMNKIELIKKTLEDLGEPESEEKKE
jgi:heme oxygenase